MGHRQALVFLLAALSPSNAELASATDSESELVLKRATAKIEANSHSIENYTCMETVQRDYYRPRAATLPRDCPVLMKQRQNPTPDMVLRLSARDRLRLEVATSSRGEINSWPGASRFSDSGFESLAIDGPIGTGYFGALLKVIFLQDTRKFGLAGDTMQDGRLRFVYTFAVPVSDSHYRIKSQDNTTWLTIAYEGVVYLDAETADPVQLTVIATELPSAAGLCQTACSLNFKRGNLGGQDLLLPAVAGQHFISANGRETQNTITFSNCRQYFSESTIRYDSDPDAVAAAGRTGMQPAPETIPNWIPFSMELLTPVDTDTAAAGDRFAARLTAPLRDGKRLIAPKGSLIEGRVSDVEVGFYPAELVVLGLIPESLEMHGTKVPFAARLNVGGAAAAVERKRRAGLPFYLPAPGEYAHQFRFAGGHAKLPRGFHSEWLTATPRNSGTSSADRQ